MARRKAKLWSSLSARTKADYKRRGVTPSQYNAYQHRRSQGFRAHPLGTPRVKKQPPQGMSLADQVINRKERVFGEYIKFDAKGSARAVRRNPITRRSPDPTLLARFLRMKADDIANLNWSDNEWAFLYYH